MKKILVATFILLPFSMRAQVITAQRLPQTNNNTQATQPAVQTAANLVKVVLVCNANNLAGKYTPLVNFVLTRDYFSEVIIDNPLSNNNPEAFIMVTAIRTEPLPFSVYYDPSIQKWKIRIDTNGQDNSRYGIADPTDQGLEPVSVLPFLPRTLSAGDKFNVLINQ